MQAFTNPPRKAEAWVVVVEHGTATTKLFSGGDCFASIQHPPRVADIDRLRLSIGDNEMLKWRIEARKAGKVAARMKFLGAV